MNDLTQLAAQCGATIYRHRLTPQSPAVAFGDEAWAKFQAEVQALRKDAQRYRYAVTIGENLTMNWLAVYDFWDGQGDFTDAIDAAIDAARK